MPKTPDQILREIIAEQVFQIAQLASQVDILSEKVKQYESEDLIAFTKRKKKVD